MRQTWDESASEMYRKAARVAVPARDEQIATIIALAPFHRDDAFRIVDIGGGEGQLGDGLLTAFPRARLLHLDGSSSMLERAERRLSNHEGRYNLEWFDLLDAGWHGLLEGADYVVSSLAIHHLDGDGKRGLYRTVRENLSDRGAMIVADLVDPVHPVVKDYFAATYDVEAKRLSDAAEGEEDLYQFFLDSQWNLYRYPDPEVDIPSRLHEHLDWLREAGFAGADCFWLRAGHAIYGGFASLDVPEGDRVDYPEALQIARGVLNKEVDGLS
ncbi:MAG: methyltransferase [Chloroflexota bacterium]